MPIIGKCQRHCGHFHKISKKESKQVTHGESKKKKKKIHQLFFRESCCFSPLPFSFFWQTCWIEQDRSLWLVRIGSVATAHHPLKHEYRRITQGHSIVPLHTILVNYARQDIQLLTDRPLLLTQQQPPGIDSTTLLHQHTDRSAVLPMNNNNHQYHDNPEMATRITNLNSSSSNIEPQAVG